MANEQDLTQHAEDYYAKLLRFMLEQLKANESDFWWARIMAQGFAAFFAGIILVIDMVVAGTIWTANHLLGPTAAFYLNTIEEVRRNSTEGINKVMAATMSEMFGVSLDPVALPGGTERGDVEGRARIIGNAITDLLEREFMQGGELSPEQGERASKMFTGFSANFAVASSFTAVVGELATGGQVEAFGEFGVELAENLGLGRLARGGIRELVSTCVATPYEWHLNKKYRPEGLTVAQAIEAYFRELLTEEELYESLARKGLSDTKIAMLIANARPVLSDGDLSRLVRYAEMDFEDAVKRLTSRGWSEADARAQLKANELSRRDGRIEESINFMQGLVRQGVVSLSEFHDFVDSLPLFETEKHELKIAMGEIFEHPRKQLTLGQMHDAYIESVVNLGEYEEYLQHEGYSDEDANTLVQLLLIDAQREREKRAEALSRKSRSRTPELALGQLRQAYIAGIINLEEWETRLVALHYNDEDRRILTLQVIFDKADEDERRRRAEERERLRKEKEKAAAEKAGEERPPETPL